MDIPDEGRGPSAGQHDPIVDDFSPRRTPAHAARAVERNLRRLVVREVGAPALFVGRQPRRLALGATRDKGDALSSHGQRFSLEKLCRRQPALRDHADDVAAINRRPAVSIPKEEERSTSQLVGVGARPSSGLSCLPAPPRPPRSLWAPHDEARRADGQGHRPLRSSAPARSFPRRPLRS